MGFTATAVFSLGTGQTGLVLEAQPKDASGADVGAAIATGFTEMGRGVYKWYTNAAPDGCCPGFIDFRVAGGGAWKASAAVNYWDRLATDAAGYVAVFGLSSGAKADVGAGVAAYVVDGRTIGQLLTENNAFARGTVAVTNNGNGTFWIRAKTYDGLTDAFGVDFNPSTGARAQHAATPVTIQTSVTRTASGPGAAYDHGAAFSPDPPGRAVMAVVDVTALDLADGNETYSFVLQDSPDNASFSACSAAVAATAVGTVKVGGWAKQRYVRLAAVLAGTTPSVTYSATYVPGAGV